MSESITIARPYAQAIFEVAKAQGKLKECSELLQYTAAVVSDAQMQSFIDNPHVSKHDMAEQVIAICGDRINDAGKNFIQLLAENRRLNVLPDVAALYEIARAKEENTVDAEVLSAYEVSSQQQDTIAKALKKRLGREVRLTCRVDDSLIGGAVVRAGDLVIDGSVAGQIQKLSSELVS